MYRSSEQFDWAIVSRWITLLSLKSAIGAKEVDEQDDIFILGAPQNALGNCIIDIRSLIASVALILLQLCPIYDLCHNYMAKHHLILRLQDLKGMTESSGMHSVILINPRLRVCPEISVKLKAFIAWDMTLIAL